MESLFPFRLDVVTVLLLAVNAVNVFTSQRNIALSNPALATCPRKQLGQEVRSEYLENCGRIEKISQCQFYICFEA